MGEGSSPWGSRIRQNRGEGGRTRFGRAATSADGRMQEIPRQDLSQIPIDMFIANDDITGNLRDSTIRSGGLLLATESFPLHDGVGGIEGGSGEHRAAFGEDTERDAGPGGAMHRDATPGVIKFFEEIRTWQLNRKLIHRVDRSVGRSAFQI
jgi:hypothetical protein